MVNVTVRDGGQCCLGGGSPNRTIRRTEVDGGAHQSGTPVPGALTETTPEKA